MAVPDVRLISCGRCKGKASADHSAIIGIDCILVSVSEILHNGNASTFRDQTQSSQLAPYLQLLRREHGESSFLPEAVRQSSSSIGKSHWARARARFYPIIGPDLFGAQVLELFALRCSR